MCCNGSCPEIGQLYSLKDYCVMRQSFFSVWFRRSNCQHWHVFMTRFFSKMCADYLLACNYENSLKGLYVTIQKMPLLSFPYINLYVSTKN